MNEWKIDMPKTASSKDFFLEIEEELDGSVIEIRYQALSKLLLSFIQLPNDNEYSFFDEQTLGFNSLYSCFSFNFTINLFIYKKTLALS